MENNTHKDKIQKMRDLQEKYYLQYGPFGEKRLQAVSEKKNKKERGFPSHNTDHTKN